MNPSDRVDRSADWVLVVDTLNYCFWARDGEPRFACEYAGETHAGYWSLPACVNRALDEGVPLLDYSFLSTISEETVANVFRSSNGTEVPMLAQRVASLREIGVGMGKGAQRKKYLGPKKEIRPIAAKA